MDACTQAGHNQGKSKLAILIRDVPGGEGARGGGGEGLGGGGEGGGGSVAVQAGKNKTRVSSVTQWVDE